MSMENYRRIKGLDKESKRIIKKKKTLWSLVKRAFNHEHDAGIVSVSTVPLITERWRDGEREIISFMVTLPCWVSEKKILEGINNGFGWLAGETKEKV